jgi:ATP-dependent DNA helicase RecQ
LAEAQDVPAYIIFHDETLMAMIETRPKNLRDMSLLSGIGKRKLELYGNDFLAVISEFSDVQPIMTDTVSESLELFRLGYTVKQVAEKRELQETTIYGHLAQSLEQGLLVLHEVIDLPKQEINHIETAILSLPEQQKNALKPIFEMFDGHYSYGVLRCVRAALLNQMT